MPAYHRETCRLCGSSNMSLEVKLEPIPLAETYSASADEARAIPRFPVDVYLCHNCWHVQQLDVVDFESLWSSYTYFSGGAGGIPEHFAEVSEKIITEKN